PAAVTELRPGRPGRKPGRDGGPDDRRPAYPSPRVVWPVTAPQVVLDAADQRYQPAGRHQLEHDARNQEADRTALASDRMQVLVEEIPAEHPEHRAPGRQSGRRNRSAKRRGAARVERGGQEPAEDADHQEPDV